MSYPFYPDSNPELIKQMLDWAKTKPADEKYNYACSIDCAITQFATENNYPDLANQSFIRKLVGHKIADAANCDPQTFGAFAARLEKALINAQS